MLHFWEGVIIACLHCSTYYHFSLQNICSVKMECQLFTEYYCMSQNRYLSLSNTEWWRQPWDQATHLYMQHILKCMKKEVNYQEIT